MIRIYAHRESLGAIPKRLPPHHLLYIEAIGYRHTKDMGLSLWGVGFNIVRKGMGWSLWGVGFNNEYIPFWFFAIILVQDWHKWKPNLDGFDASYPKVSLWKMLNSPNTQHPMLFH